MTRVTGFLLLMLTILAGCSKPAKVTNEYERLIKEEVEKLLSEMTYDEKIGQLSQRVIFDVDEELENDLKDGKIGSLLLIKKSILKPEELNRLKKIAVEESRLGIPVITGQDVIHGFQTIFPISLAQSCSWDTAMVKQAAAIAAKEASAHGIDWTFAPMVDVSRDPRWGRIAECYGEDTYLNACFAAATVKGFQGEDVSDAKRVVACLKHFVGYGVAMGGRDYQYTDISERSMHEVYLPPFKAGVDAGALTVMSAFNDINGVPATANKKLLKHTLKNNWNFPGFVVSDWDAIEQLIAHGYATDSLHAAVRAMNAGIDMEMKSSILYDLPQGSVSDDVINEAVRRILYVKFRKGLFDRPYTEEDRQYNEILTQENRQFARKAAAETMVLLENKNNTLPITGNEITISVVGPFAKEQNLMGWWQSNGNKSDVITPFFGLKANAPKGVTVIDKIAPSTDFVIVCVGEKFNLFGENNCRSDINLPDNQSELVAEFKRFGKPVITVVFNGRPLALLPEKQNSDALLLAWHPGTEAGNALADVLFGKVNPSAKLTTSFPLSVGHIPIYYNHRNSGRPQQDYYMRKTSEPLYAFGYGLSYTTYTYNNLTLYDSVINSNGAIQVSATISNTGKLDGKEIVQLYVQDLVASSTRPIKELKGFKKVNIKAGESKIVSFTIKAQDLAVLNDNMESEVESGIFKVWVATNSKEGLLGQFEIK